MLDNERGLQPGGRVGPDDEIAEGIRLGAIAIVSAVVTAVVVIGAGRSLLPHPEARAADHQPTLVRTSLP